MESTERTYTPMQKVKRHFFAMRNGIIADTLRKGGSPFKIIFGLNLPQLTEIAEFTGQSAELADALWENGSTRESMLLAPMIYPRNKFDLDKARRWVETIPTEEVADILCHRLLRHKDYAPLLADELCMSDSDMTRYTGLRLYFNLVAVRTPEALAAARRELDRASSKTAGIARQLFDEASFLLE